MAHRKIKILCITLISIVLCAVFHTSMAAGQDTTDNKTSIVKAFVISIDGTKKSTLEYVDVPEEVQTITAEILTGTTAGKEVSITNDAFHLNVGDTFFVYDTVNSDGSESYTPLDFDRLNVLMGLLILFVIILFIFGGLQGVRALASLAGSLALIFYVLLPGILRGFSPMLLSLGVASIIIVVGSFVTHGFNKTTLSAVIGMAATIWITGLLAASAVSLAHLTGYASEESVYLNSNLHGSINMAGLLLGAILIGLLGVLYDIAIGQAVSVEELIRANDKMSKKILYKRATRIGKEHIGALVNTLAIAYVGVSLPLLLLFYGNTNGISVLLNINSELFATEIVRTLVGSIGLILAVPITTFVTIFILTKAKNLTKTHSGHHH